VSDQARARALRPADAGAARALVSACVGGTRYSGRTHEVLDAALTGGDDEHIGLVLPSSAGRAGGARLSAAAVIGALAGASGAWRLHWLFARSLTTATVLASAALDVARDRGARLVVCELPDDAPFGLTSDAGVVAGFILEGAVPDFVRDGIPLRLWVARF
jgi:hypothetical protein